MSDLTSHNSDDHDVERRRFLKTMAWAGAAAGLPFTCAPTSSGTPLAATGNDAAGTESDRPQSGERPNIIVILADDLGHNDISRNGNPLVKTPKIDSIAQDGATFTTGYAGDAVCSPSRAALLTGRHPQRFGFEFNVYDPTPIIARVGQVAPELQPLVRSRLELALNDGLPKSEITLAQFLKGHGYYTGLFGKWHLGRGPECNPVNRGFDEFVGIIGGAAAHGDPNDPDVIAYSLHQDEWIDHLKEKVVNESGQPYEGSGYTSDIYANEAIRFIRKNKQRPFFLEVAFQEPHLPLQAPKQFYDCLDYIKDEKTRVYYAMIEAMDAAVGHILGTLRTEGLDRKTIVIFTSDNGGSPAPQIPFLNFPYRGWKLTYFEGGVNVPYFMRWTDHIAPGTVVPGIASQLDIFPTAAAAAGISLPGDRIYDGKNLLPIVTGKAPNDLGTRELLWRKVHYWCFRQGKYKLQVAKVPEPTAVAELYSGGPLSIGLSRYDLQSQLWLYDLELDPTERFNLAPVMPTKVAELKAALDERLKSFTNPAWPPRGMLRVDIDGTPPDEAVNREFVFFGA